MYIPSVLGYTRLFLYDTTSDPPCINWTTFAYSLRVLPFHYLDGFTASAELEA